MSRNKVLKSKKKFYSERKRESYPHRLSLTGFTLIEILISCAILGLVVAGILSIFYAADTNWRTDAALLHLSQQSRQAMDGMVRELRRVSGTAFDIAISGNGTIIDFDITRGFPVWRKLKGNNTYSIQYSLNTTTNQIIREVSPTNLTQVLANKITNLNFTQTDDIVSIETEAETNVRGRVFTFNLSGQAAFRQYTTPYPPY